MAKPRPLITKAARQMAADKMMQRTRANVALVSGAGEASQLASFMAIFHPNFDAEKTHLMVNDARERDRRRR